MICTLVGRRNAALAAALVRRRCRTRPDSCDGRRRRPTVGDARRVAVSRDSCQPSVGLPRTAGGWLCSGSGRGAGASVDTAAPRQAGIQIAKSLTSQWGGVFGQIAILDRLEPSETRCAAMRRFDEQPPPGVVAHMAATTGWVSATRSAWSPQCTGVAGQASSGVRGVHGCDAGFASRRRVHAAFAGRDSRASRAFRNSMRR